jgi:RNA polymerase sigma factor (sigma-70 family)
MGQETPAGGRPVLEAAHRGEPWAQEEVSLIIRAFARHLCRGSGASGADPEWEDVAQEASRRVFTGALATFVPGGPERSYLYSIVKATRIQLYRSLSRRRRREEIADLQPAAPPNFETKTILYRILKRLSEPCRELLERTFYDGASHAELAAELGLVESSVRSRLTRCLQQARSLARPPGSTS